MADLLTLIVTAVTTLAVLAGLLWRARHWGAAKERSRQARRDRDAAEATKRRMEDATADLGNDPDVLRDWLRTRGRE
ncbi:hypothetical protein [Antarctobacter heliothermus]|uniref:hypothetical protein n=1 Tax=Antarctobacter heliothermus TaxID=74033 RepID=UPI000B7966DF|nr:hypothetical protein [Antarctobacter heliothermus]